MNSGIYSIVNTENGKVYIGSTTRLNIRKNQHWYLLRKNKHGNQYLQRSWNKYGENSFEFRVIEECSERVLIQREDAWMDYYKSRDSNFGYNFLMSARGNNRIVTEETRKKLSMAAKGRRCSEKTKLTLSALNTGKKLSEEHKLKISKSHFGIIPGNESKLKMREAKLGKKHSLELKEKFRLIQSKNMIPVVAINKNTGEKISFESTKMGARHFNICSARISECINGKKKSHLGYVWKKDEVK